MLKEFRELAVYGQEAAPIFAPLSPREVQILDNIAQGMTNKQVAYTLAISEQTVKNHMSSILRKLSVNDRTQAVVYAMRQGWIKMPEDRGQPLAHRMTAMSDPPAESERSPPPKSRPQRSRESEPAPGPGDVPPDGRRGPRRPSASKGSRPRLRLLNAGAGSPASSFA